MSVLAPEKKPGWQKIGFLYRLDVGFSSRKETRLAKNRVSVSIGCRFEPQEKKPGWQKTGFLYRLDVSLSHKKRNPVGKKPGFCIDWMSV
jgi:hypothetical protein